MEAQKIKSYYVDEYDNTINGTDKAKIEQIAKLLENKINKEITIMMTNDWGSIVHYKMKLINFTVQKYAQYEHAIKIIFKYKYNNRYQVNPREIILYGLKLDKLAIYDGLTDIDTTKHHEKSIVNGQNVTSHRAFNDKDFTKNIDNSLDNKLLLKFDRNTSNNKIDIFNKNWPQLLEKTNVLWYNENTKRIESKLYNTFEEAKKEHPQIKRQHAMRDCCNYQTRKEYCLRFEDSKTYDICST